MVQIILASSSPRRQELLQRLGLAFEKRAAAVEESMPGEAGMIKPAGLVKKLAVEKARAVAGEVDKSGTTLVIGADTVVVHQGKVLGKPSGAEEAEAMLRRLQGSTHEVFTGLAVVQVSGGRKGREEIACERTLVRFRPISDEEIRRYVATGEPLDKAGAYAIQGLGAVFVEGIEGCFFNVVGLPLARMAKMLSSFGVSVF